ncbi:MAG: MFS transporter [Prevotellaceae bacterium]|nr:MFS transporter [Prevotellaceae bacterium]
MTTFAQFLPNSDFDMRYITRTVWILSLVSLFTDMASEMLYPILPIYLKTIGFSVVLIGILEGIAEAIAGLSKGYFGKMSDSMGKRAPFVRLGYSFSAIAKPMMALFVYPLWIFFARTLDRLGKGIRTGARDALLSDESTPKTKGRVFGFHRGMDTFGAVIGPSLALLFLYFYPGHYRMLFLIAVIPGIMAIGATLFVKDKKVNDRKLQNNGSLFSFLKYWKTSPVSYRRLVVGLLFFALFNSSDVFLLLKAREAGLDDVAVIGVYIFYNLIYALFSFPLGVLADKIGLRRILIAGLFCFAVVYFGMSMSHSLFMVGVLFFLYGIYAAATEGVSKAWISNITKKEDTATAIGTYAGFQSICMMLASAVTGFVWYRFGAFPAFMLIGTATVIAAIYLMCIKISL